jgi:hypothetical protein
MNNIDYKLFVPRGAQNFVRFPDGHEILIDDILSINIFLLDDKVVYWIYFRINEDDMYHKLLLKKNNQPTMALLIGNNPYEVHGAAKVTDVSAHAWEEKIQITVCFTVINAKNVVNNPRKVIPHKRGELLDI